MRFSLLSVGLLSAITTLSAAAPLFKRDVFVPPVLRPTTGDVWPIGSTQTVVWDASNPPAQITNTKGRIVLRSNATGLLLLDSPLAQGFDILLGQYDVVVPAVDVGYYQIVLFGDSGNWGQTFSIVNADPNVGSDGTDLD